MQALLSYNMSKDLFEHMLSISGNYIKEADMTYLSQKINNDCNTIASFIIDTFISIFINVFILMFSLLIIINLDKKIALILSILAIVYFIIYLSFRKPIYNKILVHKENSSHFFSSFFECISSIEFIKRHSIKETFIARLDKSFTNVMSSLLAYQKLQIGLTGSDSLITMFATLIVYIIGGLNIMIDALTVGEFTITLNLFNTMLNSVKFFLNVGKIYQETLASFHRIEEILHIPSELYGTISIKKIRSIELRNVNFKYGEKEVIKNFNYTFTKGNIYFLIGDNGTGKTTLLNLIIGQYMNNYSGKVLYNNIDVSNLDVNTLRKTKLGFSEQETILVADTVQNNLELFKKSDENLDYYIEKLNLSSYIRKLQNGMKNEINTQHNNISGGEKQKISIIRQLLLNPDVMIFDEPTSALENNSKTNLMEILRKEKDDKIIIIVTHDKTLYDDEDIVININ